MPEPTPHGLLCMFRYRDSMLARSTAASSQAGRQPAQQGFVTRVPAAARPPRQAVATVQQDPAQQGIPREHPGRDCWAPIFYRTAGICPAQQGRRAGAAAAQDKMLAAASVALGPRGRTQRAMRPSRTCWKSCWMHPRGHRGKAAALTSVTASHQSQPSSRPRS